MDPLAADPRDTVARKSTNRPPPSAKPGDEAPHPGGSEATERGKQRPARRPAQPAGGLDELQTWLSELIRQGLARARQQPASFFEAMALRMVEAQAPGIAKRLREWPAVFASGGDWAGRALEEAGSLQTLLNGAARLDELPAGLRASVRSALGWTIDEREMLADPGAETVADCWQVVGQRVEEDGNTQRVQRTWLIGEKTGRTAVCLSFAAAARPLGLNLVPGLAIDADLTFYPGAVPLRAAVSARRDEGTSVPFTEPPAKASFDDALAGAAALLAGDPWLERSPWLVRDCLPLLEKSDGEGARFSRGGTWSLRDGAGAVVPLARAFDNAWPLLAVSAGKPVTVFGEWEGREFLPLSVMSEGRFVALGGPLP